MLASGPSDLARVAKVSDCKVSYRTRIKILTPKQMLQRLPIALAQLKAGNTHEILLNKIRQIIYSSYQCREMTEKVYKSIMNYIV